MTFLYFISILTRGEGLMANPIQDIIIREEQKCNPEILEKVIKLISENKSYSEIMREANISLFDLSTYLEVAFYKTNLDPSILVDKEKITKIMDELNKASFPSLKQIKTKYPDCEYTEIRIVRGVYFRTTHYYQRKNKVQKSNDIKETEQMTLLENTEIIPETKKEKVDLTTVPFLLDAINTFETEHWKQFALELFAKYTPKQFFILPASMSKRVHHETELSIGAFSLTDPTKLVKMGGKYYHSYRVYLKLLEIIEPDNPEVWDYKREKIIKYVYGNEYKPWEKDIMKLAALSHDIYSGGTEDEINPRRKHMDANHAHYHKTELLPLKRLVPEEEWNAYIMIVDNHMWKWDPERPTINFHEGKDKQTVEECYKHYSLYRLVKNVEMADYLASRRNEELIPKFKQAIETWFYIKGDLNITWDDLEKMGLPEKEIRLAFAKENESLEEFIELILGDRYLEMKNQSLLNTI